MFLAKLALILVENFRKGIYNDRHAGTRLNAGRLIGYWICAKP
jgi:hypothetical protein